MGENSISLAIVALMAATVSGCASAPAPMYQPSKDNIEEIKQIAQPVNISKFSLRSSDQAKEVISLRAARMVSPYGNSYGEYLENALKLDFSLAGKLSPESELRVTGSMTKNDLDASGLNIGTGVAEVAIQVQNGQRVMLEKKYTITHTWESSFMGMEAIPKAASQYPIVIEKLINLIVKDKEFKGVLEK